MAREIRREHITGLVLAGGQGKRMGGADKGLLLFEEKPLVQHALERLGPQVNGMVISANRHLDVYRGFGAPVVADASAGVHEGPLAGMLAGLQRCETPWLVTVPCDSPRFPMDLVERLMAAALQASADAAVAVTREGATQHWQPVFCAIKRNLQAGLAGCLASRERSVARWLADQGAAIAEFSETSGFFNLNTLSALAPGR